MRGSPGLGCFWCALIIRCTCRLVLPAPGPCCFSEALGRESQLSVRHAASIDHGGTPALWPTRGGAGGLLVALQVNRERYDEILPLFMCLAVKSFARFGWHLYLYLHLNLHLTSGSDVPESMVVCQLQEPSLYFPGYWSPDVTILVMMGDHVAIVVRTDSEPKCTCECLFELVYPRLRDTRESMLT